MFCRELLTRRIFVGSLVRFAFEQSAEFGAGWRNGRTKLLGSLYPYAAGSPGDVTARIFAQRFSEVFGQPFVVENRPGANGSAGR